MRLTYATVDMLANLGDRSAQRIMKTLRSEPGLVPAWIRTERDDGSAFHCFDVYSQHAPRKA